MYCTCYHESLLSLLTTRRDLLASEAWLHWLETGECVEGIAAIEAMITIDDDPADAWFDEPLGNSE